MKNIMIASALALSVSATTAIAGNFDNNAVNVVLERNNLTFGLETVAGEATALTFGVAVLPHTVFGADADVTLGAEYGIQSEDFTFTAAYGLTKRYDAVALYGEMEAAYVIGSGTAKGNWYATPMLGVSYDVNKKFTTFGEVSYGFDVSNNWARQGGALEIGARYALTDAVALKPSIVRTFNTAADETNFKLEVGLRF